MQFLSDFILSDDIKKIESDINQGYNVKVNSVAGSGKTTTALILTNLFKTKKILLLTYNNHLMNETRMRTLKYKVKNLDVYTIHGFAGYVTNSLVKNDESLIKILAKELSESDKYKLNYDLIILDECQDFTPLYFDIVTKFLNAMENPNYQLIIFGDERQCIYGFMEADSRYLTLADKIFINNHKWTTRELKNSYRVKEEVCEFVNKIYGKSIIKSVRESKSRKLVKDKVKYCYWYSNDSHSYAQVAEMIVEKILKDGEEEVFIIAPSISKNFYISQLIEDIKLILNEKYNKDIYFFITKNDLDRINDRDLIKNKLVISTIHQTKGMERKNVFLFNFDASYYKFGKKERTSIPDNEIYVALTRASSELYIMHDITNEYFDFIDKKWLNSSSYVEEMNLTFFNNIKIMNKTNIDVNKQFAIVTDMVKFLPLSIIEKAKEMFDYKIYENFLKLNKNEIEIFREIPYKIELSSSSKNIYEEVQTIIGSSLSTIFLALKKRRKFKREFNKLLKINMIFNNSYFVRYILSNKYYFNSLIHKVIKKNASVNDLSYISFVFNWILTLDKVSMMQIKHEDCTFLTKAMIDEVVKILKKVIKNTKLLEYLVTTKINDTLILGKIDKIDKRKKIVYELKFLNELSTEHILQLIFYKYLLCQENKKYAKFSYVLYNIKNNSAIELKVSVENTKKIIEMIFEYKKNNKLIEITDEEFIQKCLANNVVNIKSYNIDTITNLINPNLNYNLSIVKTKTKQKLSKHTIKSKDNSKLSNKYEYTIKEFMNLRCNLPANFVIIDFETWDSRNNPVQISFLVVKNYKHFKSFNFYLKPNREKINPFSYNAANVSESDLLEAKTLDYHWSKISEFFTEDYIFVAYNAPFDAAVLANELKLRGIEVPNMIIFDTLTYFRNKLPTLQKWNLESLCEHFNIQGIHHNAESDVKMLSKLILKVTTWEEFTNDYLNYAKKIRFLKRYD